MKEAAETCMRSFLHFCVKIFARGTYMHYGAFWGMYIRFLGLQLKEIYVLFICLLFDLALLLLYSH